MSYVTNIFMTQNLLQRSSFVLEFFVSDTPMFFGNKHSSKRTLGSLIPKLDTINIKNDLHIY